MSKEIMQQALAYIKDIRDHCACEGIDCEEETNLVVALEQELAKPEKEPKLSDAGAETNISRGLEPKGSGMVTLNQVGMRVDLKDATPRKEYEIEQARREERGWCHQLVWDYGFSRVDNEDVQEACSILAKQILARSKK